MKDERGKTDLSSYDLTDSPTRRAISAGVQRVELGLHSHIVVMQGFANVWGRVCYFLILRQKDDPCAFRSYPGFQRVVTRLCRMALSCVARGILCARDEETIRRSAGSP